MGLRALNSPLALGQNSKIVATNIPKGASVAPTLRVMPGSQGRLTINSSGFRQSQDGLYKEYVFSVQASVAGQVVLRASFPGDKKYHSAEVSLTITVRAR